MLLLFNSFLLAKSIGIFQLPGELSRIEIAKQGAIMSVEFSEQMAKDADVYDTNAVKEIIAQYRYEIEKASSAEEVVTLISSYSMKVQEIISREQDNKRRETVLSIINKDEQLSSYKGEEVISLWKGEEGIKIIDPTGLLSEKTKETLFEHPLLQGPSWSLIEISIKDGQASLMTTRSMLDKMRILETDNANLESRLKQISREAGYAELSGSGIIVEMYDSENGYSSFDIVHDRDVRDVVNELFSAGAKGISIGDQRLITTSSIRCAGPIILVNQKAIAVDPITIKAIGDPEVLASSLELIKAELGEFGIGIKVSKIEQITLPPYSE